MISVDSYITDKLLLRRPAFDTGNGNTMGQRLSYLYTSNHAKLEMRGLHQLLACAHYVNVLGQNINIIKTDNPQDASKEVGCCTFHGLGHLISSKSKLTSETMNS
jgi:hypothetical protein